jgi:hypothetical protein
MQKINRETLTRDLAEFKELRCDDAGELHGENKTVYEAAALLLKITDPEFVPSETPLMSWQDKKTLEIVRAIWQLIIKKVVE